jgi:hypothetical protein
MKTANFILTSFLLLQTYACGGEQIGSVLATATEEASAAISGSEKKPSNGNENPAAGQTSGEEPDSETHETIDSKKSISGDPMSGSFDSNFPEVEENIVPIPANSQASVATKSCYADFVASNSLAVTAKRACQLIILNGEANRKQTILVKGSDGIDHEALLVSSGVYHAACEKADSKCQGLDTTSHPIYVVALTTQGDLSVSVRLEKDVLRSNALSTKARQQKDELLMPFIIEDKGHFVVAN